MDSPPAEAPPAAGATPTPAGEPLVISPEVPGGVRLLANREAFAH